MERLPCVFWVGPVRSPRFLKESEKEMEEWRAEHQSGVTCRLEDAMLMALKMEEKSHKPKEWMQTASRSWKRQGKEFPSIASKMNTALVTSWF